MLEERRDAEEPNRIVGRSRDRSLALCRIIGDMPTLRTARSMPLNFGGRSGELSMLSDRLAEIMETGDAGSGVALIVGVPGSGKTTLARTFARRKSESAGVAMIEGGVSRLNDPLNLFLEMGVEIGADEMFREIAGVDSRLKSGGVGVGIVKGVAEYEHVRTTGVFESLLNETARQGLWDGKALILVVDELQRLTESQSKVLADLHQGLHHCPILVVGAGLQNTEQVLARRGISRISDSINLGPLNREATRDIISTTLIDLEREAPLNVVDALADASHDFPQHIHCYLKAAVAAVNASVGWHAPGMLKQVLAKGDEFRAAYYDSRLLAMDDGRPRMLPLIERMVNTGVVRITKRSAEKAITEAGEDDGELAVSDAIQHGVLTLEGDNHVSFGIPSFHGHMVGVLQQHRDTLRREQQMGGQRIDR